jgi:hypothetical protein
MRRKRGLTECLWATDLNITEIALLLDTSKAEAKAIFTLALQMDKEKCGQLIRTDKVSQKSVLKVKHITFAELERNVKMRIACQTDPHSRESALSKASSV